MDKPFKLGLVIGRFQHLHEGHINMIDTALTNCEKVLLLVGSSQEYSTIRNPFSLYTRMNIIREVYWDNDNLLLGHIDDMTSEDDISDYLWGDFVLKKVDMWRGHYAIKNQLDCMIYGNDEGRDKWYRPESIENVGKIVLPRSGINISGTRMREYIANDDFASWFNYMPLSYDEALVHFHELQDELLDIPFYKEMLNK